MSEPAEPAVQAGGRASGSPVPRRKAGLSTAWYIGAVVLALLLPCLVLAGVFTHKLLQSERSRLEADTVRLTADLAANLDRFVSSRIATLQALATSPALDKGDYARFEEQARAFTEAEGAHLILRDRTDRQRVNTRLPRGASLATNTVAGDAALLATGQPFVSDLVVGPNTGAPLVLLRVPVVRDGETRYFLSLALSPARLAAALDLGGLAMPYRSVVADRRGRIITRSLEPTRFIGKTLPGFDEISGERGSWTGINVEGLDVFGTFQRSALTGWLVTTGLERTALEAPLHRSLWLLGALAAALLALGLAIAIPIARRLVAAQGALAVIARALHDDEIAPAMATGVRETDQVAAEMREAALRLRWQAGALEEANRELEQRVVERTAALTKTSDFLRATLDSMDQGLAVIDADGRLPIISRRAVELLGLPPEILGTAVTIEEIRAIQETMGEFEGLDAQTGAIVALDPVREAPPAYERTRANGVVIEIRTVAMENGGVVRTYTDITERKETERRIEHLARHDELTGLPNRSLFRDHLNRSLAHARRHGDEIALLCLDLDRFKAVNDTYGHLIGDELLRQVATRLKATLCADDMLARLGGDEFAMVSRLAAQPDRAMRTAGRMIAAIKEPFTVMGQKLVIGLSIGIAYACGDGGDTEQLHHDADAALYAAKAAGRNTMRVYGGDGVRMVANL